MMDQRSIKPGLYALTHPKTGQPIEPLGFRKNGSPIWPVIGASPDDDSGEDDSGDDDQDDDEDDDEESSKDEKDKKSKKKSEDDDDDDDEKPKYTEADMYAVKRRMRKADQRASAFETELNKLKAQLANKKTDDDSSDKSKVDTTEVDRLAAENKALADKLAATRVETAFARIELPNGQQWVDVEDAVAAAQRMGLLDDVLDDDGTVDKRALRSAVKELARRKKYLVKKASGTDEKDSEEGDDDQGSTPRRTASKMNGKRTGTGATDRGTLAKRFSALNRV